MAKNSGQASRGLLALLAAWAVGLPALLHYRPAWTPEKALQLLRDESGTAFDAGCVAALERVLGRQEHDPGWVAGLAPQRASPQSRLPR